ncbi:hypothetical protein AMTRI_Chr06g175160 [Amborella trichopoda]
MFVGEVWIFEHFKTLLPEGSSRWVEAGIPRAARWVLWNPYVGQKDIVAEDVHQRVLDRQPFETALFKT